MFRLMTRLARLDRVLIAIARIGPRGLGLMIMRVRFRVLVRGLLRLGRGRGLGVDGGVRLFDCDHSCWGEIFDTTDFDLMRFPTI